MKLLINSIYLATEGEGIHIGTPQVFVRFQGCAVGCLNCDSKDTWDFTQEMAMNSESVVERVVELSGKIKRVSITGGDPLHPKHEAGVLALVKDLKSRGYYINIEAAGTRVVDELFDLLDYISFDFKTLSTGVTTRLQLIEKMAKQYAGRFQVKAVIETRADFDQTLKAYYDLHSKNDLLPFPWVLTPSYNLNEVFPLDRFKNVIEWNQEAGAPFRVIGQQHKWIFGPDQKQV